MKKILLTLVWMFVFFLIGNLLMIIVVGFFPLPGTGDVWLRFAISAIIALFLVGFPILALILGIRGILPGTGGSATTRSSLRTSTSSKAMPPPILNKQTCPRQVHHAFTHENIPASFILASNRGQYLKGLFGKELKEIMRQSWRQVAGEVGEDPSLADQLDLTAFRNDPYFCVCWEFPPPKYAGESVLGLLVVGPIGEFKSINWDSIPVRYFILERDAGPTTRLLEWSTKGYQLIGMGPVLGEPTTMFTDMVFEQVMGKKSPTAQQVAKRLLILKHIGTYAQAVPFGQKLNEQPDVKPDAKADLHTIFGGMFSAKLREENLWDEVSPKEKQLLESHVKDITQQQLINALWRIEAIQVLMWALGYLSEIPPYGTKATSEIMKQIPQGTSAELIASAKLKDRKEIERAREIAELWHWRSRTRQMQEEGRPCPVTDAMKSAGLDSYEAIIRTTTQVAVRDGTLLTKNTADDFLVCAKSYRDMTADEWADVRSITMERHVALNWLCGRAPGNSWDNTPTDT